MPVVFAPQMAEEVLNLIHEKEKVISQLKDIWDLKNDTFVFLAGNNYRKYLLPHIEHYEIPMKNLKIGEQLKCLKENTSNKC